MCLAHLVQVVDEDKLAEVVVHRRLSEMAAAETMTACSKGTRRPKDS
jgi:hypothetical protein